MCLPVIQIISHRTNKVNIFCESTVFLFLTLLILLFLRVIFVNIGVANWLTIRSSLCNANWTFTKKQKKYYSGKKKRHTLKTQLLINPEIGEIISLAFAKGKVHDFQLFKSSKIHLKSGAQLTADSGYQGLTKLHTNSVLPKKSSKNQPLSKQDRKQNKNISRKRIAIEHVIASVKRFRILSECYRNRRKRFSLIAGICNFEQLS